MGLFDALFGKKKSSSVEVVPDRIWLTENAKYTGLIKEAKERAQTDTIAILLVAHFSDVLAHLEKLVEQGNWNVPCKAVLASNLSTELASSLQSTTADTIDVIVGERHPLPSVDDKLEEFAETLPCRCRFAHHMSLEDPIMRVFAGDSVKMMLSKMGMKEDEVIESQLVARRVRSAQRKIEGRAFGSLEASSAEEWISNNCPDVLRS